MKKFTERLARLIQNFLLPVFLVLSYVFAVCFTWIALRVVGWFSRRKKPLTAWVHVGPEEVSLRSLQRQS